MVKGLGETVAPSWWFEPLIWGHFFWFPLAILLCLALSPFMVSLRILPCVCTHLLVKIYSSTEACWKVDISYYEVASPPL